MSNKESAIICVDASNFHYGEKLQNWNIDYKKFIIHFQGTYDIYTSLFYEGMTTQSVYFDQHPNGDWQSYMRAVKGKREKFKRLRGYGWKIRKKPVMRVYDRATGEYQHKCNFDVELTVDSIDLMEKYDTLILGSGDGDFVRLVNYLKSHGKKVVVVSWKDRLNSKLGRSATNLLKLAELKKHIERLPKAGQTNIPLK